jgi:hypothetical protein
MKQVFKPNILTACAACHNSCTVTAHIFHLGSSSSPHTRIQYQAALYHDPELQINFCDAYCATAYKNPSAL